MTRPDWRMLALTTLRDPATAGRILMSLELPRNTLWSGVVLVAALNAFFLGLSNILLPVNSPIPAVLEVPLVYFVLVNIALTLSAFALTQVGGMMGGIGRFEHLLLMTVWVQFLRVLVQAAALLLMLTIPTLSGLLVLVAAIWGLFVMAHLVNQAHGFSSLAKALGAMVGVFVALVLGISVCLSLLLNFV